LITPALLRQQLLFQQNRTSSSTGCDRSEPVLTIGDHRVVGHPNGSSLRAFHSQAPNDLGITANAGGIRLGRTDPTSQPPRAVSGVTSTQHRAGHDPDRLDYQSPDCSGSRLFPKLGEGLLSVPSWQLP
jgi:hypothetical protein